MLGRVAQGWSEVSNAEPGQGALHARCFRAGAGLGPR